MNHIELGQAGEKLAVDHLRIKKHTILSQNYRFRRGEIDIISESENFLIATEVKTRQSRMYGNPVNAVSLSKQRQLVRLMNAYVLETKSEKEVRFDVISIILNQHQSEIEHIEGAFYPLL